MQNEKKGKLGNSYADLKANILVEVDHMSMVCELQFLLDFMIESKKKSHAIYEIVRTKSFVQNVAKSCGLYSSPTEEVLAIAMRQDYRALARFMVNHPSFNYFEKHCDNGSSLIHFLAQGGSIKLMKLLSFRGWNGCTSLMFAARSNQIKMVKFLCDMSECNLLDEDVGGSTAFIYASKMGHTSVMGYYLEAVRKRHGYDEMKRVLNDTDRHGQTGLFLAAWKRHVEGVRFLVGLKETDLTKSPPNGDTPLHTVSEDGYLDIAKMILASPHLSKDGRISLVLTQNGDGRTALDHATSKNRLDVAEVLSHISLSLFFLVLFSQRLFFSFTAYSTSQKWRGDKFEK